MRTFWIFTILLSALAAANPLPAADVAVDAVLKFQHFQQATAGAPVIPAANGYSFQAFVVASTNNAVTGAFVQLPNATTRTLVVQSEFDLRFEEFFNTSSAMDLAYPHSGLNGYTYTMQMQTVNDGARANNCTYVSLILGLGNYPVTPQISNWSAVQQIDHTRGFTVQWNSLGGNTNDIVQLLVYLNGTNVVYASPVPFTTTNALNATSNQVTIPGYSLPAGTNLTGQLIVIHIAGQPDKSYAVGAAGVAKDTTFPMQTLATPPAPTLTLLSRTNKQTQLRLVGQANRTYQIQATDDWLSWEPLLTTNSVTGSFFFNDTQATNRAARYYRGRVGD